EADQRVDEEPAPPDEQEQHEDVNPADQVVDLPAVARGERRHAEPLSHVHGLETSWSFDHSRSSSSSALRLAHLRRWRKKATIPPCTAKVTRSMATIPS